MGALWDGQTNKTSAVVSIRNEEEEEKKEEGENLLPEQKYFCHSPDA